MKLSFDEIKDGYEFEDLVATYFKQLKGDGILSVEVKQSGIGIDGGRDILVIFKMQDPISFFERKWVIQCKFHQQNISPREIKTINIPSLIHSYNADGYLLICRKRVTSGLSNFFENLEEKCKFGYQYKSWGGAEFIDKFADTEKLLAQFFPNYATSKNVKS